MAPVEVEVRKLEVTGNPANVRWHIESALLEAEVGLNRDTLGEVVPRPVGATFCLRVDHGLADGIGTYILAGKYLELLAKQLASREDENFPWMKATENIPKAWVEMLNEQQKTAGRAFEENVRMNTNLVLEWTVGIGVIISECCK